MKISVLGTGMVGHAIGSRLIELGHEVRMGSRTANNEKALAWVADKGANASTNTFANAAQFADEIVFNCTKGIFALDVLKMAGQENLKGKILIDVSNPLDFSKGMPPTLTISNTDSLAEQVQNLLPDTHVVKALNTMNCNLMLNPSLVAGNHNAFLSGNDEGSKEKVKTLLQTVGWSSENIIDLGDISTARGTEMLLPIWIRLWGALGTDKFNFYVQKG